MAKSKKRVKTLEGELPEGTARVDLSPSFLKEGREGLAGLLSFFLGQGALPQGQRAGAIPPELLFSLFGIPREGAGEVGGIRDLGENGDGRDGFRGGGERDGEKDTFRDLPLLPTLPGLPGFLEGEGRGPNVAAAVAIPAGLSAAASIKSLLSGGPKQPAQVVGGGGGITPIFPDINQQQLQLFLQLLQQLDTGGPAAALGPNPHTADVAVDEPTSLIPGVIPPGGTGGGFEGRILPPNLPGLGGVGDAQLGGPTGLGGEIPGVIGSGGDDAQIGDIDPPPVITEPIDQPVIPDPPPVEDTPLRDGGTGETGETGETDGGINQTLQDQLRSFLGQAQTGNTFQDFAQFFSLPTFEGPFTTPATDLQRQALGASSEFLGTDLGERTQTAQDALQELIRTGGEGAPGVDPLSKLTRETSADPTLNEFLQTGGGRFDLSPQFSALEAINKRRLDEQIARQREQFGVLGARFGTDIARGRGELESRFLEAEAGQRAEIAGQSFREQQQRRLQSLGLASGRDISREQIGLAGRGQELDLQTLLQNVFAGQQTRRLQGLGLGEQQRQTDITARGQRGREITEGFRLGEAERQIGDTGVQRQLGEFARTQGALLPMLLRFFSQGVGQDEIVLPPE